MDPAGWFLVLAFLLVLAGLAWIVGIVPVALIGCGLAIFCIVQLCSVA